MKICNKLADALFRVKKKGRGRAKGSMEHLIGTGKKTSGSGVVTKNGRPWTPA